MVIRLTAIALFTCMLAGCKSIDGAFYPGCIAFEGDQVRLSNGEFVWEKFTDQIKVDDDGNVIDPYPDYPKHGTYLLEGQSLTLTFDSDDSSRTMHVHRHDGRLLLLTNSQLAEWELSGRYDDCALTRDRDNH